METIFGFEILERYKEEKPEPLKMDEEKPKKIKNKEKILTVKSLDMSNNFIDHVPRKLCFDEVNETTTTTLEAISAKGNLCVHLINLSIKWYFRFFRNLQYCCIRY